MAYDKIPESVIEAVLRHHDIVETVGKYVHLTKHGKYMKGLMSLPLRENAIVYRYAGEADFSLLWVR